MQVGVCHASNFISLLLVIPMITRPGQSHILTAVSDGEPKQSWSSSSGSNSPSFEGFHFKACCFELPRQLNFQRNASGSIMSMSGINSYMLSWPSFAYNSTYECLTFPPPLRSSFENTSTSIGFNHMLKFQMCDAIVGPVTMIPSRFLHFDFLHPYMDGPAMMLIPKPKISVSYLDVIWKPFQPTVWLVLLILLVVVTLALALLDYFSTGDDGPPRTLTYLIKTYGLFVFQTVALQGGSHLSNNKLKIRLAMGTWCLMCPRT